MIDYAAILSIHYSQDQWSTYGDEYEGIVWLSDTPKPSQSELDALWPQTKATLHANNVDTLRHSAYVAESDPIFFRWQRGEATELEWREKVAEIKARYPR